MTHTPDRQDAPLHLGRDNEVEWERLRRTLTLTDGFALHLISVHDAAIRTELIKRIQRGSPDHEGHVLTLSETTTPEVASVLKHTEQLPPHSVVILSGLNDPRLATDFWLRLNERRNLWQRQNPYTHLWFVNRAVRQRIRTQAPDIYSIRSADFLFTPLSELTDQRMSLTDSRASSDWLGTADDLVAEAQLFADDKTVNGRTLYGRALVHAAWRLRAEGRLDEAAGVIRQGLALTQEAGAPVSLMADFLVEQGQLEHRLGHIDAALGHYQDAIALFRQERDNLGLANALTSLGDLEHRLGHIDAALGHYQDAIALYRQERANLGLANVYQALGDGEQELRHFAEAEAWYLQARELYITEREPMGLAYTLSEMARVASACGNRVAAAEFLRDATAAAKASNVPAVVEYVLAVRREVFSEGEEI